MKLQYLTLLLVLCLSSCKSCKDDGKVVCLPNAAVNSLRFRLLDATTGHDLFMTGLSTDSVTASQPCFTGKQVAQFNLYTIPNTAQKGYTFTFTDLRNAGLSELDTCFSINVKWNSHSNGVIRWHYHVQQVGDCPEHVVDFVSLDNMAAVKVDDGTFTYWALRK